MSPALIDTGAQAQSLLYHQGIAISPKKGQIFSSPIKPVSSSFSSKEDKKDSIFNMNPYGGQSGYENSSTVMPNFEFSTPGNSKLGPEKPAFSALSRPRMVKTRKSVNTKVPGSSETQKIDPGFNPFRPVGDNLSGVSSSRLDSDVDRNKHFDLKVTSKVEKAGNALIEEIRKLRIENQAVGTRLNEKENANLSGMQKPSKDVENSLPPELPDNLQKLNLNQGASLGFSGGRNVGNLFGGTMASELPNDLQNLNIKDFGDVGSQSFVPDTVSRSNFVFGSKRASNDAVASGVASTLPDKIKSLNIDDSNRNNDPQTEINVNNSAQAFGSGKSETATGSDGVIDPMILDEIERLKIGDNSERSSDDVELHDNMGKEESHPPVPEGQTSTSTTSSFSSTSLHFQPAKDGFQVPCMDGAQKKASFSFSGKRDDSRLPHVEFRTPDPKVNMFSGSNQNIGFSAKKGSTKDSLSRGRKGKVKEHASVLKSLGKSFVPKENSFQAYPEPSESSSPMDVSPYQQTQVDKQSNREPFLMSDNQTSTDSHAALHNDATDEDLVDATECMDINKDNDLKTGEAKKQAMERCMSAVGTESFKSCCENMFSDEENEVESNSEVQSGDQTTYVSASSSVSSGCSSFTFAASSSAHSQVSASTRLKKKNRMKAGPDIYNPTRTAVLSDAASSLQFSAAARVSVLPPEIVQRDVESNILQNKGLNLRVASPTGKTIGANSLKDTKREVTSPTATTRAAQEACEKWRLRGNQAYSNGDLEKAEDYYTQGLSCIPQKETSRDCLRAAVLCYSNRAATRMSLGRMSDALRDCLVAADIDPNFFRVQLRAANCYLALGEVGAASQYFKKLLQSTDVCVERKIILEASDGIQKAQKVIKCMERSAVLLQQKTSTDAENALGVIAEALAISPYSEQLLEHKAAALFMLRRYEEVIQLCEQTLEAAEKNSHLSSAYEHSSNLEASEILKNYSFWIWRYSIIFKSNFYLGKLEEAIDFLQRQEQWRSMMNKCGHEALESLIPQVSIARELIRHKSAGNEAFQSGRHTEAVEHYTAALSFNVESRPFAAVCFGNRAAAFQALGQVTDAIADCSLAIALDGNYFKAISRRATLFEMIRDYEQAAKDLESLVALLTKQAEEKNNQSGASLPMSSLADLRQARQRLYQMEEQSKKGISLNFYLILGVEQSVTAADLKKAYRKAALRHHPDKAGQSLARSESGDDGLWKKIAEEVHKDADRLFKMIGEAYAVLSEPTKRSHYDIDEETRNGQRKGGINSMSRMHTDAQFNSPERGSGIGRHWREAGRSSANPYYQGFEPRSSRYY